MRTLGLVGSLVVAISLWATTSLSVFGADNQVVTATVSVQDVPCITVGTTNIVYGQKAFSTSAAPSSAVSNISNIDSCSTAAQTLNATGSQATATGATWDLAAAVNCSGSSLNEYRHTVRNAVPLSFHLTMAAQPVVALSANQQDVSLETTLLMPCAGSQGAGKTMNMNISLVATIP